MPSMDSTTSPSDQERRCGNPACSNSLNPNQRRFCSVACLNVATKLARIARYEREPSRCANPQCAVPLPYERRTNTYCSNRCAATHTQINGGHRTSTRPLNACAECGVETRNPKFCSTACAMKHRSDSCDRAIESASGQGFSHTTLRRYMRKMEDRCRICSTREWNGKPVPLVMDHIDGDSSNNHLDNLRLVCPNCDAQLPTFKSRNRGNGRAWRRDRYRAGLSY